MESIKTKILPNKMDWIQIQKDFSLYFLQILAIFDDFSKFRRKAWFNLRLVALLNWHLFPKPKFGLADSIPNQTKQLHDNGVVVLCTFPKF